MNNEYKRAICEYTKEETKLVLKIIEIIKIMDENSNGEIKIKRHRNELKSILGKSIRFDDGNDNGSWMQLPIIIDMNYNENKEDSIVTINYNIMDYIDLLERELKKKIDA